MSPEHLSVIMFAGVLVMVMAGFPLYLSLGSLGLYFGIIGGWAPQVFHQFISRIYGLMANEVLPAVPLFVFMGVILSRSGAAERLFNALYLAMGTLRGGLAQATIALCTLFAATAGIVGATETTVGLMALPAMLKRGYNIPLACGAICAGERSASSSRRASCFCSMGPPRGCRSPNCSWPRFSQGCSSPGSTCCMWP